MSLPWFRMYGEAVDDEKLRLLAFEDRWHFVALLCCKSQGVLDTRDSKLRSRKVAIKLGVQLSELDEIARRLREVGLIDENLRPLNWEKRQFQSDVSTQRVRKYRNRKDSGNVSPPLQKRSDGVSETDQIQNRTDTDTEQKKNIGADAPKVDGLDADAWTRWLDYRKQIRKPLKPASIPAAQKALAAFGCDQAAVVEQSIAQGWTGLFALKTKEKPKGNGKARTVEDYRENLKSKLTHEQPDAIDSTATRVD